MWLKQGIKYNLFFSIEEYFHNQPHLNMTIFLVWPSHPIYIQTQNVNLLTLVNRPRIHKATARRNQL